MDFVKSLEETWQWHLHALWASQAVGAHHQEPELSITGFYYTDGLLLEPT